MLTKAGVVDAGAAGLVEILRGISAHVSGEPLPEAVEAVPLTADAVHQEASRYRYCAVFVVEGENLDRDALERELEPLGDSLLVVGDAAALKAHVHTDDPGAALRAGTAMGVIERVEIANMHLQSAQREERLSHPGPDDRRTAVVAVVTGEGNRRLFESMGATGIVDGGETMNPSTEELVPRSRAANAPEAVVLRTTTTSSSRRARRRGSPTSRSMSSRRARSRPASGRCSRTTRSPAPKPTQRRWKSAAAAVAAGGVTVASRAVSVDGLQVERGAYLGLVGGDPVAGGTSFDTVATSVVDRLLAEPRDVLTLITGEDEPELGPLLARVAEQHPDLELEVHPGGQPHYPLLLAAE